MKARVTIMPKSGVLDPQGKAIESALVSLGFDGVASVRQGKIIDLELDANSASREQIEEMCRKLLANPVMENFTIEIAE
jgi:phosphoribosylformylglycinamidine synthase